MLFPDADSSSYASIMTDAEEKTVPGSTAGKISRQMIKRLPAVTMQDFRFLQVKINSAPQCFSQRFTGGKKTGQRLSSLLSPGTDIGDFTVCEITIEKPLIRQMPVHPGNFTQVQTDAFAHAQVSFTADIVDNRVYHTIT